MPAAPPPLLLQARLPHTDMPTLVMLLAAYGGYIHAASNMPAKSTQGHGMPIQVSIGHIEVCVVRTV